MLVGTLKAYDTITVGIDQMFGGSMKTIRELRVEASLTQLELANAIGVTPSAVYKWERGQTEPSATNLRELAEALGVSMDAIDMSAWYAKSAA
jgi:transcriptional regulator with XRE-family HTH domain